MRHVAPRLFHAVVVKGGGRFVHVRPGPQKQNKKGQCRCVRDLDTFCPERLFMFSCFHVFMFSSHFEAHTGCTNTVFCSAIAPRNNAAFCCDFRHCRVLPNPAAGISGGFCHMSCVVRVLHVATISSLPISEWMPQWGRPVHEQVLSRDRCAHAGIHLRGQQRKLGPRARLVVSKRRAAAHGRDEIHFARCCREREVVLGLARHRAHQHHRAQACGKVNAKSAVLNAHRILAARRRRG